MHKVAALLLTPALLLAVPACDDKPKDDKKADAKNGDKKADAKNGDKKADAKNGDKKADAKTTADATPVPAKEAAVGKPAPDFELKDLDGKAHKLSDLKGKTVVLEWFNPGCPFVKYAHGEGPLKDMAKKVTGDGSVAWLAINSGGPGKQGHGLELNKKAKADWAMEHPILLDEDGAVGHRYGAAKTPHIFIVNKDGVLAYAGALDNKPAGDFKEAGATYEPYAEQALTAIKEGKPVETAERPAYGCSVKYTKKS